MSIRANPTGFAAVTFFGDGDQLAHEYRAHVGSSDHAGIATLTFTLAKRETESLLATVASAMRTNHRLVRVTYLPPAVVGTAWFRLSPLAPPQQFDIHPNWEGDTSGSHTTAVVLTVSAASPPET